MEPKKMLTEVIVSEIMRNRAIAMKEEVERYAKLQRARSLIREHLAKGSKVDSMMKRLLKEDIDKIPYNSTAMNVLKDLLKKIVPILESGYKMLTSDREQRKSFEAHIIVGLKNSIGAAKLSRDADTNLADTIKGQDIKQYLGSNVPPEVDDALNAYDEAQPMQAPGAIPMDQSAAPPMPGAEPIQTIKELANNLTKNLLSIYRESVSSNILREAAGSIDFSKFVPKEPKPEVNPMQQEENPAFLDVSDKKPKPVEQEEQDKLAGLDKTKYNETGRNIALDAFSKIEKSITAAYNLLADAEDRKVFYIYLIANIVMHFNRFEDELNSAIQSSEVIPQQSQDKVNKANEQPSDAIGKALGTSKPPAPNISKPNIR